MAQDSQLSGLSPQVQLAPGGRQQLNLVLANLSDIVDQFSATVTGLPAEWFTLVPDTLPLFPGATGTLQLTLHPPASPAADAGDHPFSIVIASGTTAAEDATYAAVLLVGTAGRLAMDVAPVQAEGRSAVFQVKWQNQSNGQQRVQIAVKDAENRLRISVTPDEEVLVPAGGEAVVAVEVVPLVHETIGEPHAYEITFSGVRPGSQDLLEPSLRRMARYTYVPPVRALALPSWLRRMPFWAILALLLLLMALLFLAGNRAGQLVARAGPAPAVSSPTPIPATNTASPLPTATATATATATPVPLPGIGSFGLQVGANGAVRLAWSVAQASTVTLNGKPVGASGEQPIEVKRASFMVLTASNAGGTVSRMIRVVPPPTKRASVAKPPMHLAAPVVRQFTVITDQHSGAVSLVWQAQGSDTTTLNGKKVRSSGKRLVAPGDGSSFVLRVMNGAGTTTDTLILPASPPLHGRTLVVRLPSIQRFSLGHARAGQPYVLAWRTRDAAAVTLNGRAVASVGSQQLSSPIRSTSYVLAARGSGSSVMARLQVQVQ